MESSLSGAPSSLDLFRLASRSFFLCHALFCEAKDFSERKTVLLSHGSEFRTGLSIQGHFERRIRLYNRSMIVLISGNANHRDRPSRKSRVLSWLLRFTLDCPIPPFNRQRECRVGPLCGFFSEKTGLSESRFPAATQPGLFSSQERRKESQQRKNLH
jgi:hypothetical protein